MDDGGWAMAMVAVALAGAAAGFLAFNSHPATIFMGDAGSLFIGVTLAAIQGQRDELRLQVMSLGASRVQTYWKLISEARLSLVAALAAGFGAIISEVGAVMMVGGNIKGHTRLLTTAIVMETGRGNFALAIALSVILLAVAFLINFGLTAIQQGKHK